MSLDYDVCSGWQTSALQMGGQTTDFLAVGVTFDSAPFEEGSGLFLEFEL